MWRLFFGSGIVSAEVSAQANSSPWAKAGATIRFSTNPGSPYYAVYVTPSNGVVVQRRSVPGGSASQLASVTGATPVHLEVTETGGRVHGVNLYPTGSHGPPSAAVQAPSRLSAACLCVIPTALRDRAHRSECRSYSYTTSSLRKLWFAPQ